VYRNGHCTENDMYRIGCSVYRNVYRNGHVSKVSCTELDLTPFFQPWSDRNPRKIYDVTKIVLFLFRFICDCDGWENFTKVLLLLSFRFDDFGKYWTLLALHQLLLSVGLYSVRIILTVVNLLTYGAKKFDPVILNLNLNLISMSYYYY